MLQRVNLYFWGFTDLLLSFWCLDDINKKRKNAPLSAALLSFCLVCEISLCTSFQTYLRRDFVTTLYLISFFYHQAICIHCPLHPQPSIFIWKKPGHILGADTSDLWGKSFQLSIQQCALCCCHACGRVALSVSGFPCKIGRYFLLEGFRHKTVV